MLFSSHNECHLAMQFPRKLWFIRRILIHRINSTDFYFIRFPIFFPTLNFKLCVQFHFFPRRYFFSFITFLWQDPATLSKIKSETNLGFSFKWNKHKCLVGLNCFTILFSRRLISFKVRIILNLGILPSSVIRCC